MILASVLFGISIFLLSEEASPPAVLTMMLMSLNVLINSEDLASAPYSSTRIKENLLSWLLNSGKSNLSISRGGRFLLYGNPKGYEVSEQIDTIA